MSMVLSSRLGLGSLLIASLLLSACGPAGQTVPREASSPRLRFPVVYSDLDGTALDPANRVRPETLAALEAFRRCGGRFGIATGRSSEGAEATRAALRPDLPFIVMNGALTLTPDAKTALAVRPLSAEAVRRFLGAAQGLDGIEGIVVGFSHRMVQDRALPMLDGYFGEFDKRERKVCAAPACDFSRESLPAEEQALKILVVSTRAKAETVRSRLEVALGGEALAYLASPEDATIDIVPLRVNKGMAIAAALAPLGIAMADVLAFGDGDNDLEMLGQVGLGVAMGNGVPGAKAAALVIGGSHDTDAIARVLRRVAMTPACQ